MAEWFVHEQGIRFEDGSDGGAVFLPGSETPVQLDTTDYRVCQWLDGGASLQDIADFLAALWGAEWDPDSVREMLIEPLLEEGCVTQLDGPRGEPSRARTLAAIDAERMQVADRAQALATALSASPNLEATLHAPDDLDARVPRDRQRWSSAPWASASESRQAMPELVARSMPGALDSVVVGKSVSTAVGEMTCCHEDGLLIVSLAQPAETHYRALVCRAEDANVGDGSSVPAWRFSSLFGLGGAFGDDALSDTGDYLLTVHVLGTTGRLAPLSFVDEGTPEYEPFAVALAHLEPVWASIGGRAFGSGQHQVVLFEGWVDFMRVDADALLPRLARMSELLSTAPGSTTILELRDERQRDLAVHVRL